MKLYDKSQLTERVARICRVAGKVNDEIHTVLCSIMAHTMNSGDYTAILPLMNGLPKGQRLQAIALWVKHFSGGQLKLALNAKTKIWGGTLKGPENTAWNKDLFDLPGAIAVKFGDFSEEPKPSSFDMEQMIDWLKAKIDSKAKNPDGSYKVTVGTRELASKLMGEILINGWNDPKLIAADKSPVVKADVPHKASKGVQMMDDRKDAQEQDEIALLMGDMPMSKAA